jgi:hypothetical protein
MGALELFDAETGHLRFAALEYARGVE